MPLLRPANDLPPDVNGDILSVHCCLHKAVIVMADLHQDFALAIGVSKRSSSTGKARGSLLYMAVVAFTVGSCRD